MKNPRILIIRTDRIGDVVLSTPLPREIKLVYPKSIVVMLVRSYTADIFKNNPYVDDVIIHEGKYNGFIDYFNFIKRLRKYEFTHSFSLLPTSFFGWAVFWAGIRLRVGVGRKFFQFVTNAKSVYRNKYIPLRNEADYCLDFLRKIGIDPKSNYVEIHLSEKEKLQKDEIRGRLLNGNPNKTIVGLHTSSGNSSSNLPPEEYLKLARELDKCANIKVVITDSEAPAGFDYNEFEFITKGKNLRESIIDFSALNYLISASTGPMHIASALKVRTIALFCRLPMSSIDLWGTKGNDPLFILPEEDYCKTKCPGNSKKCFYIGEGGINATKVLELTLRKINSELAG